MLKKRDYYIIGITCLALGYILVRQFYLQQIVIKVTQPETGSSMALEVTELIKTNDKLRKEIDNLNGQLSKLGKSTVDLQAANEALNENLEHYKIVLGLTKVKGSGVEITFPQKIESTQLIDLINAIKNIGVEAIAINNNRFGPYTSIESGVFYPPTVISVIGDQELLNDSLIRPGGIIEQIGNGEIEKKDNLKLKSI